MHPVSDGYTFELWSWNGERVRVRARIEGCARSGVPAVRVGKAMAPPGLERRPGPRGGAAGVYGGGGGRCLTGALPEIFGQRLQPSAVGTQTTSGPTRQARMERRFRVAVSCLGAAAVAAGPDDDAE